MVASGLLFLRRRRARRRPRPNGGSWIQATIIANRYLLAPVCSATPRRCRAARPEPRIFVTLRSQAPSLIPVSRRTSQQLLLVSIWARKQRKNNSLSQSLATSQRWSTIFCSLPSSTGAFLVTDRYPPRPPPVIPAPPPRQISGQRSMTHISSVVTCGLNSEPPLPAIGLL